MDCGGCTGGLSCGGDGIANLCGSAPDSGACTLTSCTNANGKYCGVVGDGCGGSVDCGGCSGAQTCGGAGPANLCGVAADSGACTALRCNSGGGAYFRAVAHRCGGSG